MGMEQKVKYYEWEDEPKQFKRFAQDMLNDIEKLNKEGWFVHTMSAAEYNQYLKNGTEHYLYPVTFVVFRRDKSKT